MPSPIHTVLHSDTTDCKHKVHMHGCLRFVHDNDGSTGSVGSNDPSERPVPQVTPLTGSRGSAGSINSAGFTGTNRTNSSQVHCLNWFLQ
jgi:hypothetical protein